MQKPQKLTVLFLIIAIISLNIGYLLRDFSTYFFVIGYIANVIFTIAAIVFAIKWQKNRDK